MIFAEFRKQALSTAMYFSTVDIRGDFSTHVRCVAMYIHNMVHVIQHHRLGVRYIFLFFLSHVKSILYNIKTENVR